ncbi:uncharacterized protein NPIL_331081 [Nephila pilipes]|uniref:Uncharacterized protein n=1 Tax=Nephila pilipes TaxID=299642 RepID=A0A8X6TFY9_NEPPI|nr:uncharacterized protein NPIL_331081 [Nephila pilipes]
MKDENCGKVMTEFIGLRSKMYSFKVEDCHLIKKLKGVKKSTLEKKIDFEDYRRCLLEDINLYSSMNLIRSVNHDIYTVTLNMLALSAHDEKSKNPDIMETVDTKQENYQNQSTDKVDKTNTITSISPKEHVETRPKDEANAEGIEEEIGNIAPGKYKNIPKKILNFIQ